MSDNVERKRTPTYPFSLSPPRFLVRVGEPRRVRFILVIISRALWRKFTTKYMINQQALFARPNLEYERQGHSRALLPKTRGAVSPSVLGKVDWPTGSRPGSRCRGGSKVDDMHFVPDEVMAGPKAADNLIPSHAVNSLIRRSDK
ncbi:hypothetical protein GE21DRAFT_7642 [Neurospora crassa]|uniref:Uncharacterized protein n=1 Tax=Neurospora crassa (strain ATCC 24698 / 74-OR23-1A / CBS 708.71 / DSM 1257 / FGSC 987) TaxID=367110 RepID=V5IP45_NEUCR|nr:hypothetical protein NCU16988 [Neurospora crassa OR74A]ESA42521.1 hypothetical protein NCU16988 [Neurospora crassa OR74A]KHE87784.1 hypothetical protein GE21DRAFT_7642 [Neurospora crassa]|eukprot:XP_011394830.1 hypothetical protein NCU16988 [Neurospora crassa OR74A]